MYFLRRIKKIFYLLRIILNNKNRIKFFRYRSQRSAWLNQGGKITKDFMILNDYDDDAGKAKGHYFHQDLLVARFINQSNPKRHIDIGSRIDGFVAHVASYRKIEVIDIRPVSNNIHKNIKFLRADLMNPLKIGKTDSISCLHAIEHFGLGRYSDPIDISGHIKGIENIISVLEKGGKFYLSFPIATQDEIHFNAHRIFNYKSILKIPIIKNLMVLERFDYIDDEGDLHLNINLKNFKKKLSYGCGIYTFKKK